METVESLPSPHEDGLESPRSIAGCEPNTNVDVKPEGSRGLSLNKRISFHENLITAVIDVPCVDPELKQELFYNKTDFSRFQMDEKRRYDKMMIKKIQKMVEDKMADQLAEAYARGASQEEIAAMMPQTPEEIFAVLGLEGGFPPAPNVPLVAEENLVPHGQAEEPVQEYSGDGEQYDQSGEYTADAQYAEGNYAEGEYVEGECWEYAEGDYAEGEHGEYVEGEYADGEYADGEYEEGEYGEYGEYAEGEYAEGEYAEHAEGEHDSHLPEGDIDELVQQPPQNYDEISAKNQVSPIRKAERLVEENIDDSDQALYELLGIEAEVPDNVQSSPKIRQEVAGNDSTTTIESATSSHSSPRRRARARGTIKKLAVTSKFIGKLRGFKRRSSKTEEELRNESLKSPPGPPARIQPNCSTRAPPDKLLSPNLDSEATRSATTDVPLVAARERITPSNLSPESSRAEKAVAAEAVAAEASARREPLETLEYDDSSSSPLSPDESATATEESASKAEQTSDSVEPEEPAEVTNIAVAAEASARREPLETVEYDDSSSSSQLSPDESATTTEESASKVEQTSDSVEPEEPAEVTNIPVLEDSGLGGRSGSFSCEPVDPSIKVVGNSHVEGRAESQELDDAVSVSSDSVEISEPSSSFDPSDSQAEDDHPTQPSSAEEKEIVGKPYENESESESENAPNPEIPQDDSKQPTTKLVESPSKLSKKHDAKAHVIAHVDDEEKWSKVEPHAAPPPEELKVHIHFPSPATTPNSAESKTRKQPSSSSNKHCTRKTDAPAPKQRRNYNVGGSWGTFEFGMDDAPRGRKKGEDMPKNEPDEKVDKLNKHFNVSKPGRMQ